LNQAQQTLCDPDARREYDLERQFAQRSQSGERPQEGAQAGTTATPQRDLGQLLRAEQLVREAINLVKQNKSDLAQAKLSEALTINEDDPLAGATQLYVEALNLRAQGASNAVINGIADKLEALTGSYDVREEPFYFLGMTRVMTNDYKRAVSALERATAINPHYAEANSQLRFAQRQLSNGSSTSKPKSSGGLFGRRK
jgi:tetratricopeptide (TPR) repeat protein